MKPGPKPFPRSYFPVRVGWKSNNWKSPFGWLWSTEKARELEYARLRRLMLYDEYRIKETSATAVLRGRRYSRERHAATRWAAECIIASAWDFDGPQCMWSTLPDGNPLMIAAHRKQALGLDPCDGASEFRLEFDHVNGGGRKDGIRSSRLSEMLVDGERDVGDFRLLCPIHNQWNILLRRGGTSSYV